MRILVGRHRIKKLRNYLYIHPKHWLRILITKNGRGKVVDVFVMILNWTIYFYFRVSINKMVKRWLKRGYPDSEAEHAVKKFIYLPKWAWRHPDEA